MNPCTPPIPDPEEFTLEDILREFGSDEPQPEPVTQDTIVLDDIVAAAAKADLSDNTLVFTPVAPEEPEENPEEEPEPIPLPSHPEPKSEPFSEDWEPEYDEPMGEFTPKAPIPFPQKNRLRQLRQKLVAGPERRYQALAEVGVSQLQVGIVLNLLLALLSIGLTVSCALGFVPPQLMRALIFCQLLLADRKSVV